MLKKYSLKALQKAVNATLSLDPNTATQLKALDGKVLQVVIKPLDVSFFIQFGSQELILLDAYDGEADTVIHSSPIGLIRLSLLPSSRARSLFNDQVLMTGDIELGQKIKHLFDNLDIDWEGHLAQFTGDVVAFQIGSLVRKGLTFQKHVTSSINANISDYLQEELCLVPSKHEVDDFFADVDTLSLDVERLQARINQCIG